MNELNQRAAEPHAVTGQSEELAEQERLARVVALNNHLAVFALALSVARIEISTDEDTSSVTAFSVKTDHQAKLPFPAGDHWQVLFDSSPTESGFCLQSNIKFATWFEAVPRIFPSHFDMPFLGADPSKTIVSSHIRIERPSPVIPTTTTILGITAIHTAESIYNLPRFDVLNDEAGLPAFKPLLTTLSETSGGTTDYSGLENDIEESSSIWTPSETRDAHFATPEELGVPPLVMDRAQHNFAILLADMGRIASPQLEP